LGREQPSFIPFRQQRTDDQVSGHGQASGTSGSDGRSDIVEIGVRKLRMEAHPRAIDAKNIGGVTQG
jgi:hypothetical protein